MEELDGMDWPRLMRALRAAAVDRVEQMLPLFYDGKWEPGPDEWRLIAGNDRLWRGAGEDEG